MMGCFLSVAFLCAQSVTLTFTGSTVNNQYIPLNRVIVSNLTKGWQETLTWPDTVLVMSTTGIHNVGTFPETSLQLSQNTPNPFNGTTFVNLQVTEPGDVTVVVTDIIGRTVSVVPVVSAVSVVETFHETSLCKTLLHKTSPQQPQPGIYQLRVSLSPAGIYFLTARQNGHTASIKMVNIGDGGADNVTVNDMVDINTVETFHETSLRKTLSHKTSPHETSPHHCQPKYAPRGTTDNPFDPGDQMEYVGFAIINGMEVESFHITQDQYASETIVLSFANIQPCLNNPTVTDIEGNVYNTLQIGSQCWIKENLRTTMFEDGTTIPMGALYTSPEPHYYDDSSSIIPLEERGYLYNWAAAMHNAAASAAAPSGVRGICPEGWHLPSDAEWIVLKNFVSSQSEYICAGNTDNIAKALASTHWWSSYSEACVPGDQSVYPNNATGFSAVPAGTLWVYGYNDASLYANFWSSTENDISTASAIYYGMDYDSPAFFRASCTKDRRAAVRCLRN